MNISINGTIASFLLAVLVYWLFSTVVATLIKDSKAQETFKIILLIICVVIALGGSLFLHL